MDKLGRRKILVVLIFGLLFLNLFYLGTKFASAEGSQTKTSQNSQNSQNFKINVLYIAENVSYWRDDSFLAGLSLDPLFNITFKTPEYGHDFDNYTMGSDLHKYFDLICVVDVNFSLSEQIMLRQFAQDGGGIILLCGPVTTEYPSIFGTLGIISNANLGKITQNNNEALTQDNTSSPVNKYIDWNSAPSVSNYTSFGGLLNTSNSTKTSNTQIFAFKANEEQTYKNGDDPLIFSMGLGSGRVSVFSYWLSGQLNLQFILWPYYNYMIYTMALYTTNHMNLKQSFANWQYSPVPHQKQQIVVIIFLIILVIITIFVVIRARRKSRREFDPDQLKKVMIINQSADEKAKNSGKSSDSGDSLETNSQISKTSVTDSVINTVLTEDLPKTSEILNKKPMNETLMGESPAEISETPAMPPEELENLSEEEKARLKPRKMKENEINDWEDIGFHRQIGGFFTSLFISVVAAAPQIVVALYIFPRYIMPFPMAGGFYAFTTNLFSAIWLVLDFGTSTAMVKFFAHYRITDPRKAARYVQFYIFWQFITGIAQFGVVAMLAMFVFPNTGYSHLSWFFFAHSMIQFPGFLSVLLYFFQGAQRLDLNQVSSLIKSFIINLTSQYLTILLFRDIYRNIPQYGEVFGTALGFAVGSWIGEVSSFWFMYVLFKKAFKQLSFGGSFFRMDFGMDEIKDVMKYGWKLVLGNVWVPANYALQVVLLSIYVLNYSSEIAYFDLASTITGITGLVGTYLSGALPALSEARGNNKPKLLELAFVESVKWSNNILFFLVAVVIVLGPKIIIAFSGPTWTPAIAFLPGLLLFAALGPTSWLGDAVFQSSEKTVIYDTYAWFLEQGTRAILLFVFISTMRDMNAVLWAYNPALFSKNVFIYIVIRKKITKPKWYFWKCWIAPLLSALITLGLFNFIANLIWRQDFITTGILFIIGIFGFLNFYFFLLGFLGGFDDNTLRDFDRGTSMVRGFRFLARMLYISVELGAIKLKSPLFNKFKIDVYEAAMKEAKELTMEKRVLVF